MIFLSAWNLLTVGSVTSIVQTRAFSFSDDSANVALPFSVKQTSPSTPNSPENMWTRTNEISSAFIEWRRLQSSWYTELYQSGRDPWPQPYQRIWKIYHGMEEWFKNLPASMPPRIREFMELDLLYSYVCVLAPNSRCPRPTEHAQRLLIEHATTYAERIKQYQSEPTSIKTVSPFTFYDALRVYSVGRQYIDALASNLDDLLQAPHETSWFSNPIGTDEELDPLSSPPATQPALPKPTQQDHILEPIARAIDTINTFLAVLSAFGQRFGCVSEVSWRDRFQREAQPILSQLHGRLPRHDSTGSTSSYFWPSSQTGPITPQTTLDASPQQSNRLSASFYPSPAATSYSPGYVPQDGDNKQSVGVENGWPSQSNDSAAVLNVATHDYNNVQMMNEFGIGNTAAWETLPGGSMNVRFL
jgi:hypothetical protein